MNESKTNKHKLFITICLVGNEKKIVENNLKYTRNKCKNLNNKSFDEIDSANINK